MERATIKLECARDLKKEFEKNAAGIARVKNKIEDSLHETIRAQLEPDIRKGVVNKIYGEVEGS